MPPQEKKVVVFIRRNWIVILLTTIYLLLLLSVINWGIPNPTRVFLFHMDEWHQLMSIRALVQNHTTTIEGAAHGAVFHFLTAGAFLGIFQVLGVINIFDISHSVTGLQTQEKVFIILRFSTLLYGLGSIAMLSQILRKQFRLPYYWYGVLLFIFSPTWLSLSNYFKYDIALIFWILSSMYLLFRFIDLPSYKNYFLAAIACGLAFDTKISAFPIFILFFVSYFLAVKKRRKNILLLVNGVSVLLLTVFILGLPDLLLGNGDYSIIISDVVFDYPANSYNYNLGSHFWLYLFFNQVPTNFGRPLTIFSIAGLVSAVFYLKKNISRIFASHIKNLQTKKLVLTLLGLLVFAASLYPLKLFSSGNRMLVLLPFIVILTAWVIAQLDKKFSRYIVVSFLLIAALFQVAESLSWLAIKWQQDPRQEASTWVLKHIPAGSTIGVLQPLIYQMGPDIILKDYSFAQEPELEYTGRYTYVDISDTDLRPAFVVLTNLEHDKHKFVSDKTKVYNQLVAGGYQPVAVFSPHRNWNAVFNDAFSFSFTNLVPTPLDITILENTEL